MRYPLPSLVPVGAHLQDATISAATVLTKPAGTGPDAILVQCTGRNVMFTLSGTTPTAALGFILYVGADPILIDMSGGQVLTVIEVAASATIEYQWVNYGGV